VASAFADPIIKPIPKRTPRVAAAAQIESPVPAPIAVEESVSPPLQTPGAEPRSYTTTWADNGFGFRAVMFPHVVNGCKVLIQSSEDLSRGRSSIYEMSGPDCNCDLLIDGQERYFAPAKGYAATRLLEVCQGPGVDGVDRRLEIMRESLKLVPDFSKMENVQGFEYR
jgi:hypothetical protein